MVDQKTVFQKSLIVISWFGLVLLGLVRPVMAAIKIEPTFQTITLTADQATVQSQIQLTNTTSAEQIFQVFATDIQQFDKDGRVTLADRPLSGTNYTLAEYVQIQPSRWVLPAHQTVTIPFKIINAQKLSPGGHYAAVVARLLADQPANQSQFLPALSSFILVRKVGGEEYHLSLNAIDDLKRAWFWRVPTRLRLTFSNQGNVHVVPHGLVELTDWWGHKTHRGVINEDSVYVLPGTQREVPVTIQPLPGWAWPALFYTVTVTGQTEPGQVVFSQSNTLVVVSPGVALLICLGIAGGVSWVVVRWRMKKIKKT